MIQQICQQLTGGDGHYICTNRSLLAYSTSSSCVVDPQKTAVAHSCSKGGLMFH